MTVAVGVPVLLWSLTAALPVDLTVLGPSALAHPDDGGLLLLLLLAVAWSAWAVMAASILIELVAAVRQVPAVRVPGLAAPQRLAAALVAAVVLGSTGGAVSAPAAARPADLLAAVLAVRSVEDDLVRGLDGRTQSESASPGGQGSTTRPESRPVRADRLPTIVTQRHDTLWLLAEQHLGAGERFTEIVDLNRGVRQPDGRAVGDSGRLYPGWTLRLPADADLAAERQARHVVERGETLWDIADEALGDPTRYPQIAAANRGDLQPDGRRLSDPDLILPGWVLEVHGASKPRSTTPSADAVGPDGQATSGAPGGDEATSGSGPGAGAGAAGTNGAGAGAAGVGAAADASSDPTGGPSTAPSPADAPGTGLGSPGEIDRGRPRDLGPRGSGEQPGLAQPPEAARTSPPEPDPWAGGGGPESEHLSSEAQAPASADAGTPTAGSGPGGDADADRGARPVVPGPIDRAVSGGPPEREWRTGSSVGSPAAGTAPDAPVGAPEREAAIPLPAGGAAAGLLLVAVAGELARRRRRFQRWRRPGEYMKAPARRAGRLEATLAGSQASESPSEGVALQAALTLVAQAGARSPGPRVRLVEVGPDQVRVTVTTADLRLPPPFVPVGDAVWSASVDDLGSIGVGRDESDVPGSGRALLTVGTCGSRTVLVDLEAVGTLRVVGDDQVVASVLRAMALEVAVDPRFQGTTRTLCLLDASIAGAADAGEVIVDDDPQRVGRAVLTAVRRAARVACDRSAAAQVGAADSSGLVAADDQEHGPAWADPFEIVIADRGLGVDVLPGSGVGMVTCEPGAAVEGVTLAVRDTDHAILLPDGLAVVPVRVTPASAADVVELMATTDLPEELPSVEQAGAGGGEWPSDGQAPSPDATPDTGDRALLGQPASAAQLPRAGSPQPAPHGGADSSSAAWPLSPGHEGVAGNLAVPPASPDDTRQPVEPGASCVPESAQVGSAQVESAQVGSAEVASARVESAQRLVGSDRETADDGPRTPDVALPPHVAPGRRVALPRDAAKHPRLLLLGEVLVEDAQGRAESARIGRLAETAAFVLLNPGTRQSELLAALWPGRHANPQSCRQMISRTRTWLGRTDDGEPYLMPFAETDGRLRLRAEVGSDWADFQELARRGLADPTDVASLEAALALVRGRPFGSLWNRELAWADAHVHRMISRIVDVAHELAVRHEAAGRLSEARDAVHRGMRTQAESEALDRVLVRLRRP